MGMKKPMLKVKTGVKAGAIATNHIRVIAS